MHLLPGVPVFIFTTSRKDEIVILHQEMKSKDKTAWLESEPTSPGNREPLGVQEPCPSGSTDRGCLYLAGAPCPREVGVGGGPQGVLLGSEPSVSEEQLAEGWAVGMRPGTNPSHFHIPMPCVSKPRLHGGPVLLGHFMAFFFNLWSSNLSSA